MPQPPAGGPGSASVPVSLAPPQSVAGSGLLQELAAILRASDIETAWASTVAAFRTLGFVHVIYGYSPDSRGSTLGAYEDALILSTLPRAEMGELLQRGLAWQSRSFAWALQNCGLRSWSIEPHERAPDQDARSLLTPDGRAFFARIGLTAGVAVGFRQTRTRGTAVMGLTVAPGTRRAALDAWLAQMKDAVFVLAKSAHLTLSALPWTRPCGDLTQRQREVLEWVAEGKTTADIALILGLTPATVEKHLRLARQCLGVETTAHALIKASYLNQVFVRPVPRSVEG